MSVGMGIINQTGGNNVMLKQRTRPKVRRRFALHKSEQYVCERCWFEAGAPQACHCGNGVLKRERRTAVLRFAHG